VTDGRCDILLVEDSPDDVKLMLRALRTIDGGPRVHVARDGAEALEFVFGTDRYAHLQPLRPPRLILLDLKLPLVTGIEVLRHLKSRARDRSIPVVVMTSSLLESDMRECYELGVNSYLVKPVDFDQLIDIVPILVHYWLDLNQQPGQAF